jgi:chitin deacetylase
MHCGTIKTKAKRRRDFLLAWSGVLCAIAASGCARSKEKHDTAALPGVEVAQAAPIPTPRPTPTPDPLLELRRAHQLPNWAKKQILHKVHVRPGEKVFALTFDDGPWPVYTRRILRVLAENDVKATFFMVGDVVRHHAELAREVRDAGHAIGNHSWNHPSRPRNPVGQVRDTDTEIEKVLGLRPTLFRPPYGIVKNGMAAQAMREGDAVIIWSADSSDWRHRSSSQIASTIIRQASPGGIALMHDGGGNRAATAAALPTIISTLRERGYRFVTVPELLRMRYVPLVKAKPKAKSKAATKSKAPAKSR